MRIFASFLKTVKDEHTARQQQGRTQATRGDNLAGVPPLDRGNPDKRVYNRSLKDYINIRYLSITETMRHAAKTYASTLAMLQLDTILRYSVKFGKPKPPKKGVKNQEIFSQMQEMHCELVGIGMVKMMVGVKRSGEKIQYCITAITA